MATIHDATGATAVFGTSSFSMDLVSIETSGMSRESIPTSHLGTTTAMTFAAATLADNGEVRLKGYFDPAVDPPIEGAAETLTITWPGGRTWAASVFMTGYETGASMGEQSSASATFKVTGDITLSTS